MALKTIQSFQLTPTWRYGGSTGKLRLYYGENFVDNEQRAVIGGAIGSESFYDEATITIAANVATVSSFALVTTEDSSKPNVKVSGVIYDQTGARKDVIFEWSVPDNTKMASPATYAQLDAYNQRRTAFNIPPIYQTQAQVIQLFNALLAGIGLGLATPTTAGIVKISAAAADPVAWERTDPNARNAQMLKGVALDDIVASPADTNVIGFDAGSNTYKPLATATPSLHASSHQVGGLDELDVTDLSGLLATPQIPVAHAVLHETGGLDEINVGGLSGLLADPQTPADHAASHISGGSDAFTADQLLEAVIKRIQESSGPTDLEVGAVADGEFLKREGATIVGAASPGGPATQIEETSGPTTLGIAAIGDGEFLKRVGTDIVSAPGTGGGYDTVEDEGAPLAQRSTLNFTGAGVTATDSGGKTVVDIPGGGGSTSFATISKLV